MFLWLLLNEWCINITQIVVALWKARRTSPLLIGILSDLDERRLVHQRPIWWLDCHLPRTLWLELMSCTVANVRSAWFADIALRPWKDCLCHDPWSLVDVDLLFTDSLSLMVQLMATSLVSELLKHVSPCCMPSLRAAIPLSIGRLHREVAMIACLRRGFNCNDGTSVWPDDCQTEPIA